MNNNEPLIDLTRWLGAFPVILQMIVDEPLMIVAGAALIFGFAWLLVWLLTDWGSTE